MEFFPKIFNKSQFETLLCITHYNPVLPIYNSSKHQKPKGFLMFLGGIDKQHRTVMG